MKTDQSDVLRLDVVQASGLLADLQQPSLRIQPEGLGILEWIVEPLLPVLPPLAIDHDADRRPVLDHGPEHRRRKRDIAVAHDEVIAEMNPGVEQRPDHVGLGVPPVDFQRDRILLDLFTAVAADDNNAFHSHFCGRVELPFQKGTARHGHKAFRPIVGQRRQAATGAGGQNNQAHRSSHSRSTSPAKRGSGDFRSGCH